MKSLPSKSNRLRDIGLLMHWPAPSSAILQHFTFLLSQGLAGYDIFVSTQHAHSAMAASAAHSCMAPATAAEYASWTNFSVSSGPRIEGARAVYAEFDSHLVYQSLSSPFVRSCHILTWPMTSVHADAAAALSVPDFLLSHDHGAEAFYPYQNVGSQEHSELLVYFQSIGL